MSVPHAAYSAALAIGNIEFNNGYAWAYDVFVNGKMIVAQPPRVAQDAGPFYDCLTRVVAEMQGKLDAYHFLEVEAVRAIESGTPASIDKIRSAMRLVFNAGPSVPHQTKTCLGMCAEHRQPSKSTP